MQCHLKKGPDPTVAAVKGHSTEPTSLCPVKANDPLRLRQRACPRAMQRLKVAGPDLEAKHGMRPQIRMGLNTGAAVVAKAEDGDDAGDAVLGVTVNFAARLGRTGCGVHERGNTPRLVLGMVDASFAGEHAVAGQIPAAEGLSARVRA